MSLIEIVNKKLMLTLGMNDSGFALLGACFSSAH